MEFGQKSWAKEVFHFKYSSVAVPLIAATGIGFMLADKFGIAYCLFGLSVAWAVCSWLCSDYLASKRARVESRHIKRSALLLRQAKRYYRQWKYGGCAVLILIGGICLFECNHLALQAELKSADGSLYPDNVPDPYGFCHPDHGELAMYIGAYSLMSNTFPDPVIAIHSVPVVTLDRKADGAIELSFVIRSDDGKIIVEMQNGNFTVNTNNILRMKRPDRSSLQVRDQFGNLVLDAHYLNKNVIRLEARFYDHGRFYDLANVPLEHVCLARPNTRVTGYEINLDPKPR